MPRMRLIRSSKLISTLLCLSLAYPLKGADTKGSVCNSDPSSTLALVGNIDGTNPRGNTVPQLENGNIPSERTFSGTEIRCSQRVDAQ
jgi:hypothetical protein